MVLIKEFRIVLPVSLEEYEMAQTYMVTKIKQKNTTSTEGIEVLESRPFEDDVYGTGQHTSTVYRLQSKVPSWLTKVAPAHALVMTEEAWNVYPRCKSVLKCPHFSKFQLTIDTFHKADNGHSENVHGLTKEQLAARQVEYIDIAIPGKDAWSYLVGNCSIDFSKFKSERTGRGPLMKGWQDRCDPVMTAYKLVTIDAPYWGFGRQLEQTLLAGERALFLESHRHCFGWIDDWYGMNLQKIDDLMEQNKSMSDERPLKPARVMSIKHLNGQTQDVEGIHGKKY